MYSCTNVAIRQNSPQRSDVWLLSSFHWFVALLKVQSMLHFNQDIVFKQHPTFKNSMNKNESCHQIWDFPIFVIYVRIVRLVSEWTLFNSVELTFSNFNLNRLTSADGYSQVVSQVYTPIRSWRISFLSWNRASKREFDICTHPHQIFSLSCRFRTRYMEFTRSAISTRSDPAVAILTLWKAPSLSISEIMKSEWNLPSLHKCRQYEQKSRNQVQLWMRSAY